MSDTWWPTTGGHGFRKKKNRDTFWQLTILFFEKHLKVRQGRVLRPPGY